MCFPSKPIFIPNISQIEKQLNGNLGIAEKIESDFIKKISDSTNIPKNKERFNIQTPDGVGLKSLEQTIITSMLETLKPYMEAGLLMVDLLSAAEDIIARVLGLINPCYVPCTTSNKKSKNGSKILQLKGLNLNLDRISKKLKIALEKGDEDALKEDVVVPKDKDKTRPAEKPNRVYFAYLNENSLPIEPPSSIKDSGYWFGQFDFVLSNADLYIRRSKEIEDKFKGTPDYIQSFKSRAFENLDKICNDEYDFKTNYEEGNPIKQGNLLFQLFIKYLYNKNQNILNYQIILKENKNLSKNEFLEKAISENTSGNNEIRLGKKTFKELKNLPIEDIKIKYDRLYQIYKSGELTPTNNDLYLTELEDLEKTISQLTIPEKEKKRNTLKLLQINKNLEDLINNFNLYDETLQLKTDAYSKLTNIKNNIDIANSVYKTYNSAFGKDFDKVLETKITDINIFNDKLLNEDLPIKKPTRINEINLELTEQVDELEIEKLKYESNTLELDYLFNVIKNNILFIEQIIEQSIQNISAIENINTITDPKINNYAYIVYKKFLYTKEVSVNTLNKIKLDQQLKYDTKFKENDNYNISGNSESYVNKTNSIEISSFKEDVIITDINKTTKYDEVGKLIYKDDFRIISNTIKLKIKSDDVKEPITIEGQDLQELNGLPVYPIDSIIQKTNYLIDPMEYELEFIILDGNLLIQGYLKEPEDVKNSSVDKTKLNCGTFQYRLPDCVFTAMPVLVSTLLPKLIDLIKLVVETIQTLFSKTGIVDFLINIISIKLAKYFDQFKPSIKNKDFTNPNKLDEVEKINDDNLIKKQNVPNNPFVYNNKYLLAGSTFINLGFIKMAIELTDDVKIKTHYDKDAEKFDPDINPQVENPILRMVGQIVSAPLKFIIDSFSSLIEIIKKFFNPFSLVEAIPDFLSFKQLLDAINPFNLLASVGFGDILCMLGITTEPKPVTPIIPIPKIPNLSDLLVKGGGNVYDKVPDIPFSDIIMRCKKTRNYNNTYTQTQLESGNVNTNNTITNNDSLDNINNFDEFISNLTKENFGYNTGSNKEEFEVNIPPQTVFNSDEVIISDVTLDNKYTKEGLIPYKDKVIPGYTIKSTRDIKKSDNIEDLVKKGLSLDEIYNIQRQRYNTDRYVPSNVFKQIRENNYNPKNVNAEPKTPNKIVLPKFNISDINLSDFNLGIEELLKKPLTMAGSSVIGSLSGIVELFSFLTDLFNQFLQMPFQILGLDFLSDTIPKIPEIPNPFEKALEEILNKFEDLQNYKDKTELNIL